jgi:hypothetical protein
MPSSSSLATLADRFRRYVADWIERNPEGAARIALWMEEEMGRPEEAGAPIDLFQSFGEALFPRNWLPLGIGLHARARKVMTESGICLVWVPPAEVVEAIVRVKCKEDRDTVLLTNAAQILDAVDQALAEATHPRLGATVAAAREALAAQRAGFTNPAQSHCASVLGEVIDRHFGFAKFVDARIAFESEPARAAGLWSFRRASIQEAILVAIRGSEHRAPDSGFNRHLSAHGVDPLQFREPHALEALMLLAGAIRELHEIYRVAERGFGPSPRLSEYARTELMRRMEIAWRDQNQEMSRERALLS